MKTLSLLAVTLGLAACGIAPDTDQEGTAGEHIGSNVSAFTAGTPVLAPILLDTSPDDFAGGFTMNVLPAHTVTAAINTFDARARSYLSSEACNFGSDFRRWDADHASMPNFPGEHWSSDALAMVAFDGECQKPNFDGLEPAADRIAKVDRALAAFSSNGQVLGSKFTFVGYSRNGDLDTALKDLIPILFGYRSKLSPATYAHMLDYLQQVDAGPYDTGFDEIRLGFSDIAPLSSFFGWFWMLPVEADFNYAAVPETENHMHLIMSIRYLANDLLFAAGRGAQYDNTKNGMRDYWEARLSSILKHDFQEYNAKPYSRYSLDAIENLAELARDAGVAVAARAILDFSAAKYAVSSSLLRRNSPFRRLQSDDRDDFFGGQVVGSPQYGIVDEQACRFALYAGTTDLYPKIVGPLGVWSETPDACQYVARQAAGSYRVPPMIVELAQQKAKYPYFQTFAGDWNDIGGAPGALEIYDNEGPFMIAGGGVATDSGNDAVAHLYVGPDITLKNNHIDDHGMAVPTVVLPNAVYADEDVRNITDRRQTVSIQSGLCIGPGFACGFYPNVPASLAAFTVTKGNWQFVDFGSFYVVKYATPVGGVPYGFIEGVPANLFASFADFQNRVAWANPSTSNPVSSTITQSTVMTDVHYTSPRGGLIVAHADMMQPRVYPISQLRGLPLPAANTDTWPLASGMMTGNHDAYMKVNVPSLSYGTCEIDLRQPGAPRRGGCDNLPVDYTPPPPPPHSSLQWQHVSVPANGSTSYVFPANAINAGWVGTLTEYICSVTTNGAPRIGHFDLTGKCWTSMPPGSIFGNAASGSTEFDVLVYNPDNADDQPDWLTPNNHAVPPNAFVAGQSNDGSPVHVCQINTGGAVYPGMLNAAGCWVAQNGMMTPFATYDVLAIDPLPPVPKVGGGGGGSGGGLTGGSSGGGGGNVVPKKPCNGKVCPQ